MHTDHCAEAAQRSPHSAAALPRTKRTLPLSPHVLLSVRQVSRPLRVVHGPSQPPQDTRNFQVCKRVLRGAQGTHFGDPRSDPTWSAPPHRGRGSSARTSFSAPTGMHSSTARDSSQSPHSLLVDPRRAHQSIRRLTNGGKTVD